MAHAEKKRFLLVASYANSVLRFRWALIQELISKGLEVHVAAPELDNSIRKALYAVGAVPHNIKLARTGLNPFRDIASLFDLVFLILKISPNYILSYTAKPVIYASLASVFSPRSSCFALITGLGYGFQDDGSDSGVKKVIKSLYRLALSNVDKVFFQNADDERLFRVMSLIKNNIPSIIVNGSGVDVYEYPSMPIPMKPIRFLMICRFLGSKGIREYVKAAEIVASQRSDIKFSLVGWVDDGPDAISNDELQSWTCSGLIEYLGRLEDVRPALRDCSVFVLPSYREGTSRTVLEAMATARPIITTDAPGCRETVIDGQNGYVVPVRDSAALAEAMLKFIEQPESISLMGKRSRQIAEEKYDVHKVNQAMLEGMGIL